MAPEKAEVPSGIELKNFSKVQHAVIRRLITDNSQYSKALGDFMNMLIASYHRYMTPLPRTLL